MTSVIDFNALATSVDLNSADVLNYHSYLTAVGDDEQTITALAQLIFQGLIKTLKEANADLVGIKEETDAVVQGLHEVTVSIDKKVG